MKRTPRVVAAAVVVALCVVAARVATSADANGGGGGPGGGLTLTTSDEKADMIGKGPRTESWVYWGRVREPNQPVGFYRAKCFWVLKAAWPDNTTQDLQRRM